jgi:DNA-directed RNA polymerase specialized sigma24 family protein
MPVGFENPTNILKKDVGLQPVFGHPLVSEMKMPSSQIAKLRQSFMVVSQRAMHYTRLGFEPVAGFAQGNQPMPSEGSVTHWIDLLQAGDAAAAQPLWDRYFRLLVDLARRKLLGARPQIADEEDVALSAFDSLCRGLKRGRFPDLNDRDNLWKLLVVLTARKACHLMRDERRLKRGGGQTAGADQELENVASEAPSPEFAAELAENCQRLLDFLGKADLRTIALSKMEGYTAEEIAGQLNCAPRTVERKLRLIRSLWEKECPP